MKLDVVPTLDPSGSAGFICIRTSTLVASVCTCKQLSSVIL